MFAILLLAEQQYQFSKDSPHNTLENKELKVHITEDLEIDETIPELSTTFYGNNHVVKCITSPCFTLISDSTLLNVVFDAEIVAASIVNSVIINVTIENKLATAISASEIAFLTYQKEIADQIETSRFFNMSFDKFPVIGSIASSLNIQNCVFNTRYNSFCNNQNYCDISMLNDNFFKFEEEDSETLLFSSISVFRSNYLYSNNERGPLFNKIAQVEDSMIEEHNIVNGYYFNQGDISFKNSSILVTGVEINDATSLFEEQSIILEYSVFRTEHLVANSAKYMALLGVESMVVENSIFNISDYELEDNENNAALLLSSTLLKSNNSILAMETINIESNKPFSLLFSKFLDTSSAYINASSFIIDKAVCEQDVFNISLIATDVSLAYYKSLEIVLSDLYFEKVEVLSLSNYNARLMGEDCYIIVGIEELLSGSQFYGFGAIESFNGLSLELALEGVEIDQMYVIPEEISSGENVYVEIEVGETEFEILGVCSDVSIQNCVVHVLGHDENSCMFCAPGESVAATFQFAKCAASSKIDLVYNTINGTCVSGEISVCESASLEHCQEKGCIFDFVSFAPECDAQISVCYFPFLISDNLIAYEVAAISSFCLFGYLMESNKCKLNCEAFAIQSNDELLCSDIPASDVYYPAICLQETCECITKQDILIKEQCKNACPGLLIENGYCIGEEESICYTNYISNDGDYKCDSVFCEVNKIGTPCRDAMSKCESINSVTLCYKDEIIEFEEECTKDDHGVITFDTSIESYDLTVGDLECECEQESYEGKYCEQYNCEFDSTECNNLGKCDNNVCNCNMVAYLTVDGNCAIGCEDAIIFYGQCSGSEEVTCYGKFTEELDRTKVNCGDCRLVNNPCGKGQCDAETGTCICDAGYYVSITGSCKEAIDCGVGAIEYDESTFKFSCKCGALQKHKGIICVRHKAAIAAIITVCCLIVLCTILAITILLCIRKRRAAVAKKREHDVEVENVYFCEEELEEKDK